MAKFTSPKPNVAEFIEQIACMPRHREGVGLRKLVPEIPETLSSSLSKSDLTLSHK